MCTYSELMDLIHSYYPQNCKYMSNAYKKSNEYLKLKEKINDLGLRSRLDKKILANIKLAFPKNYIKKWTRKDYPSIHYSVLLHKNQPILDDDEELLVALNGRRLDLEVYVSLLDDYLYTFVVETIKLPNEKDLKFSIINEDSMPNTEELSSLVNNLLSLGFIKLNSEIAHELVPNIETESLYQGEVRIFHCIFTDLVNNF